MGKIDYNLFERGITVPVPTPPLFFLPFLPPELAEASYAHMAEKCDKIAPGPGGRVYSISFMHQTALWVLQLANVSSVDRPGQEPPDINRRPRNGPCHLSGYPVHHRHRCAAHHRLQLPKYFLRNTCRGRIFLSAAFCVRKSSPSGDLLAASCIPFPLAFQLISHGLLHRLRNHR